MGLARVVDSNRQYIRSSDRGLLPGKSQSGPFCGFLDALVRPMFSLGNWRIIGGHERLIALLRILLAKEFPVKRLCP